MLSTVGAFVFQSSVGALYETANNGREQLPRPIAYYRCPENNRSTGVSHGCPVDESHGRSRPTITIYHFTNFPINNSFSVCNRTIYTPSGCDAKEEL